MPLEMMVSRPSDNTSTAHGGSLIALCRVVRTCGLSDGRCGNRTVFVGAYVGVSWKARSSRKKICGEKNVCKNSNEEVGVSHTALSVRVGTCGGERTG